eukprot:TRINITY_DN15405_c0_g3_i1.p1 TRINITY_DN15405_c0_g3~~TRINITY_DN15405_c0_g3_i1.p1  ORF type:complete len:734 (-),score=98.84 TRINITY_DN15405_c0_g3_i1:184-2385(-)
MVGVGDYFTPELLKQLTENDAKPLEDQHPHELGGEKLIFQSEDGEKAIVLSQIDESQIDEGRFRWAYKRERGVLRSLKELQEEDAKHKEYEKEQHEVHFHFVRMLEFFMDDQSGPCMIMELVKPLGKNVLNMVNYYHLKHKRQVPFMLALRILEQLCHALFHLHQGVHCVHGDVKSENVLVTVRGNSEYHVKLCDFGGIMLLPWNGRPGSKYRDFSTEQPENWPPYYPPEFWGNPHRTADPRTDVWGLGLILFDCFENGTRMTKKWRDSFCKTKPDAECILPGEQWCLQSAHGKQKTNFFFLEEAQTCVGCDTELEAGDYMHICHGCQTYLCPDCVITYPKGPQKCKHDHVQDNDMFVVFEMARQCESCGKTVAPQDDEPFMHRCKSCDQTMCIDCVSLGRLGREDILMEAYYIMLRPLDAMEIGTNRKRGRAGLVEVNKWIARAKVDCGEQLQQEGPELTRAIADKRSCYLSKAEADPVGGFALKVGESMAGKFVGTHKTQEGLEVTGEEKVLDFGKKGILLMLIERADGHETVTAPSPHHKLELNDMIYVGLRAHVCSSVLDFEKVSGQDAIPFFFEFDKFALPDKFAGYTLGPPTEANPFGLNMRNLYEINVAGIIRVGKDKGDQASKRRQKIIYPALADLKLERGDYALVFRVPDNITGRSRSVNIDSQIKRLWEKAESMTEDELSPQAKRKASDESQFGSPSGSPSGRASGYASASASLQARFANLSV